MGCRWSGFESNLEKACTSELLKDEKLTSAYFEKLTSAYFEKLTSAYFEKLTSAYFSKFYAVMINMAIKLILRN